MEITIVNLVLCIVILVLGILAYAKKKDDIPLYIGIAFGLFAVTHLLTLLGFAVSLTVCLVIIRIVAYLLVIFALYKILAKK